MTKKTNLHIEKPSVEGLTIGRAEKIAAIEGLQVTERVRNLVMKSTHLSGEERRALVMAAFSKKSS